MAGVIAISEAHSVLLMCAYTLLNFVFELLLPSQYLHFLIQRIFSLLVTNFHYDADTPH